MSRVDELEQELSIVEAEADTAKAEIRALQAELAEARGAARTVVEQAEAAGVALALPQTPLEIEREQVDNQRKGLETDLQALAELHNPPAQSLERAEDAIDVVRANNRERAELQTRVQNGHQALSRIAALCRVDKWDHEGTEIRDAVQRILNAGRALGLKLHALKAEPPTSDKDERAERVTWMHALDWALAQFGVEVDLADRADQRDAKRYRRLRVIGCAPFGHKVLNDGLVVRFTTLDAFIDDDLQS